MKKKRFAMAVVCAVMTIALAGCSMLSSKLNDITGKLVGNSYTITTYDNYGNRVMTTTGDKINVQGNAVETSSYDSDGNVITGYELSSVITITIDGKEIESCGDTCIFAQDALKADVDFTQEDIILRGHAIECRINAENPEKGFRPSPGTITDLHLPGGKGIRVDSAIYSGCSISPYYDSMVAKLIVWGSDREEAIARGKRALQEFKIEGIKTTIPFHLQVLENQAFLDGEVYTDFIETEMGEN